MIQKENFSMNSVDSFHSVGAEIFPDLCNLKYSQTNCTLLTIQQDNLFRSSNEKGFCEIVNLSNKQLHRTPFSFVSVSKLVCVLPSEWISKNNFSDQHMALKVLVVFNNQPDLLMLKAAIYDSDCHDCEKKDDGTTSCSPIKGTNEMTFNEIYTSSLNCRNMQVGWKML